MSLVCFDTQVVIWGVKQEATPGQDVMIQKAKALITRCDANKVSVMLPSLVVAELLMAVDTKLHNNFIAFVNARFIVPTFDTNAAAIFAAMWRDRKINLDQDPSIAKTRAEMKADFMIVATAIAQGADCIYTEDPLLEKFAQGRIDIRPLPSIQQQLSINVPEN
jgi:predicted nucleic acid-binding protein